MIGTCALVMIASGRLVRTPTKTPVRTGDQGRRTVAAKNPKAKRAQNAPSKAARLSGNDNGSISSTSTIPMASPRTTPKLIRDIGPDSSSSRRASITTLAVSNGMEVLMAKRIAKEWLWFLAATIAAIGLSLVYRGAFWRVAETGLVLVSIYGLSAFIRITVWAVRTVQEPATT